MLSLHFTDIVVFRVYLFRKAHYIEHLEIIETEGVGLTSTQSQLRPWWLQGQIPEGLNAVWTPICPWWLGMATPHFPLLRKGNDPLVLLWWHRYVPDTIPGTLRSGSQFSIHEEGITGTVSELLTERQLSLLMLNSWLCGAVWIQMSSKLSWCLWHMHPHMWLMYPLSN